MCQVSVVHTTNQNSPHAIKTFIMHTDTHGAHDHLLKMLNYWILLHAEVGNSLLQQQSVNELQNLTAHSITHCNVKMLSKFSRNNSMLPILHIFVTSLTTSYYKLNFNWWHATHLSKCKVQGIFNWRSFMALYTAIDTLPGILVWKWRSSISWWKERPNWT